VKLRINMAIFLVALTFLGAFLNVHMASDYSRRVEITLVTGTIVAMAVVVIVILVLSHHFREKESMAKISEIEAGNLAHSKFFAHVSHEIRAPLASLLATAQTELQKRELSPETEDAFMRIYKSGICLLAIVNDILDLSKIEAKKMTLTNEKYEVAAMICELAQLNMALIESKSLEFIVKVDENTPEHLIGDKFRIKQILINVLSNAAKYTESGSITLEVCTVDTVNPDISDLIISVSDTGRGMTEEQLASIFEEYKCFHENNSASITGTGLGMPIVKELLKLMGGEIDITSQVDKGTTVTILVPQQIYSSEKSANCTADYEADKLEEELSAVLKTMLRIRSVLYNLSSNRHTDGIG